MNKPNKILLAGIVIWAVVMAAAFYLRHETAVVTDNAESCEQAVAAAQKDINRLNIYRDCEKWLSTCDNTRFSPPADVTAPDVRDLTENESDTSYSSRTDTIRWDRISPADAFKVLSAACSVRKTGWRISALDLTPVSGEPFLRLSIAFSTARPTPSGHTRD